MPVRRLPNLLCIALLALASIAAHAATPRPSRVVNLDGVGKGIVALDGPWQFHLGDNPHWAQPDIDDAAGQDGWEVIQPDRPWGAQGHYSQSGFGWYRLHLHIKPAPGVNGGFELVLPRVSDACQVYWNGTLAGSYGSLPPHPSWPAAIAPATFSLPGTPEGVLAIRVWKGPLGSSSSGNIGGLTETPLFGDAQSVTSWLGAWNFDFLRATLYLDVFNLLYFLVAIAAFVLWLRRRNEPLLLWFAIFAIAPVLWISPSLLRLPVSSQFAEFSLQSIWQLRNVALWFLLIDILNLRNHVRLVRWAKILAIVSLAAAFADGCLTYTPPSLLSAHASAWIDGILTVIVEPCDLFLIVVAAFGFRQKLDSARWILAISASLQQLIAVIVATAQQGQRFTHSTLAQRLSAPLFHVGPVYFNAPSILDLLLFVSIVYVVYCFVRDQQTRKALLEQELHSAQELQQVLIPEKPPTMPGYIISTAYHPALDVGGDFFQVIPLEGIWAGSTLVVLGDVSGKGLRAAMAVSLIVGAVRTLADITASPAEILAGLSRRLHGRLQCGFTTCLVMRLGPDGTCTLASAGHPAPYINDKEIDLPGALPLGIDPSTVYEETTIRLRPGERCSLYTDGLLEARSATGEIFSFDRLHELFAGNVDATKASAAAVAFGQEDDITVLTLTRSDS